MGKKTKRMGRPPLPPAERRNKQINLRVTTAERRRLEAEAERLGVSISVLILAPWREQWGERK